MIVIVLHVLRFAATPLDSITVRKFSLETDKGENVLHQHFDRRRLVDFTVNRLALQFNVSGHQFEFVFERSYPIFEPGRTIKMAGSVRAGKTRLVFYRNPYLTYLLHKQGNGYFEVSPPEILSFFGTKNDAAITFINSTAVNGVVFQHGLAFDIVASANLLEVKQNNTMATCSGCSIAHTCPGTHITISHQLRPVRYSAEYGATASSSANKKQRHARFLQAIRNIER